MSSRLRSIALPAVALALALGALSGCGGDDEPAATAATEAAARRAVVHGLDPDDPQAQEVVQPVAPGAKVTIVFDAQNTSAFEWRLKENCDGPLTFDVSLLVNAEGTPAIDPAAAGYSGSGSPTKKDVEAKVTAQERFEIDVGTFTVPDDASGETQVMVSLAENRCPDPVTGTAYSPIAAGAESSGPLVLQAG